MKRILSFILIAVLLFALLAAPASANAVSDLDAAETLSALGLLKGTGNGFELERSATRAEAVAMLLRLLGKEQDALAERVDCPFDDGGWAAPLVAYAWKYGLILGQSETHFGSDEPVSARDWLTMLLRVLGYNDVIGEFTWAESIAFADSIGLTHGEYTATGEFLRGDVVNISDADGRVVAHGISRYTSAELNAICGHRSEEIEDILGYEHGQVAVHRDDLVVLE